MAYFDKDHPRLRGENGTGGNPTAYEEGITPACAGKTSNLSRSILAE